MYYAYSDLRRSLRIYWYRSDKAAWMFVVFAVLVITGLVIALQAVFAYQDERREQARAMHARNLACLARNVYFEARGEPLAGQYAVAEVTLNRRASRLFPRTICEVVYQKSWDSIRKRYVPPFRGPSSARCPTRAAMNGSARSGWPRRSTTTAIRRSCRARSSSMRRTSSRSGRSKSAASPASAGTSSTSNPPYSESQATASFSAVKRRASMPSRRASTTAVS
jgi:Cell Wall Hydrolase